MEQSKQQQIRELTDRLNRCRYEYYNLNAPSLTDAEYDALFDELSMLEKETGFSMTNSPTQTVIIRSETTLIRSAVPTKIVLKRRAKQLEKATRKQGEWESKEFRAAQGRKNHSAVVPAPENDMEKCRSGGTPKLFDRTVGVRTMQNGGQRNR